MHPILKILAAVAALACGPAWPAFHLWTMTELYSNADGTVQFLELSCNVAGEHLISGHPLTASAGGSSQTFVFPSNLTPDTQNKTLLVATEGFAALGVLTPDFVVPNGFFPRGAGVVDFAGVDQWEYPRLPTSGGLSLDRNGGSPINSPRNFAGETATLVATAPPAANFQALWWRSPAGSEAGWGINITHQGDILFATWFTYDTDGSGMWLVASTLRKIADNAYAGTLYRTTGPAYDGASFDPARVSVSAVGTASFMFSDANNGTFTSVVGGVAQSKAITRQVYASPVSTCAADGGAASGTNYQDLWWKSPGASESGWGVNLTQQGDVLFATWFTYAADGRGMWLVMSDGRRTSGASWSGTLYRTTGPAFSAEPWNPSQVTVTPVGTASFTFTDAQNGTFAYSVNGVSQSKSITRQVYSAPATLCH